MASLGTILFLLVGFWVIAIFIAVIYMTLESNRPPPLSDDPVHIPGLGPCQPIEDLVDISDDKCCITGGQTTALRFSPDLNAVVGPSATIWTQACNTLQDKDQIEECLIELKPNACNSKAAAVARTGITKYYVRNFGNGGCTSTNDC